MGSRIRIHIANADPDPEGGKSDQKRRKNESEDQQKVTKNSMFYVVPGNILGKELCLKMLNVRKIR
jgi:hypothetical protein